MTADPKRLALAAQIAAYAPCNAQEARDQPLFLRFLADQADAFCRENLTAHFTASAWITERGRGQVLMAYHRLYDAWAWTGGHADGEADLLSVAMQEATEETGARVRPLAEQLFSLEILPVNGHEKRGVYVPSHLHMNVTYLLEADATAAIRAKTDENAAVRWFSLDGALAACEEPWMVARVYRKLNDKLRAFAAQEMQENGKGYRLL